MKLGNGEALESRGWVLSKYIVFMYGITDEYIKTSKNFSH